jgi:nucleoside-diphosphate-sugar epimerase
MRVLITGATGFIGRVLVPLLRREGHQLIAVPGFSEGMLAST